MFNNKQNRQNTEKENKSYKRLKSYYNSLNNKTEKNLIVEVKKRFENLNERIKNTHNEYEYKFVEYEDILIIHTTYEAVTTIFLVTKNKCLSFCSENNYNAVKEDILKLTDTILKEDLF